MRILKKNALLMFSTLLLATQISLAAQNALDVLEPEDIAHSSTLLHKTFCGTYEPSAKIITDPLNHVAIGQLSFK